MNLTEFKRELEDFGKEKLTQLDTKIERIEHELTGLDFKEELFRLERRLARVERNKFGVDFSTHNNGDDK